MRQIQQDFNTVWQHCVVEKNPRSWGRLAGEGYGCLYNGPNGARCFYSILLTDDERARVAENDVAIQVIRELPVERHKGSESFYAKLQLCHDDAAPMAEFYNTAETFLRSLAKDYTLTIPE